MRGYWLRIALGALAIFGIGMAISTAIRKGKTAVEEVVHSARPIDLPLALIPFKVNGTTVGTMRGIRVTRSTPEKVTAVEFRVKLDAAGADSMLADCVLVVGGSLQKVDAQHAFSCTPAADTVGENLERVGAVETEPGGVRPLFGRAGMLDEIRLDFADKDTAATAAELQSRAESLAAHGEALSDSIMRRVDSAMQAVQPGLESASKALRDARRRTRVEVKVEAPPAPPAVPQQP